MNQRADNRFPDDGWLVYRHFLQAASCSGGWTTDRGRFGAELICSSLKCIKNNARLLQAVWHALWRRQSTEDLPLKVFQAFNSSMKNRFETAGDAEFMFWEKAAIWASVSSCLLSLELRFWFFCFLKKYFFSCFLDLRMRSNPSCILEILFFARPLPVFVLPVFALYSELAAACRSSQSLIRFMVVEERKAGQASLKTV